MGSDKDWPAIRKSRRLAAELIAAYEREFGDRAWPWPHVQPLIDEGWDDLDVKAWLVAPHPALRGLRPADVPVDRLIALVQEEQRGVY